MSVREFAAHLGVSDRMVSKWEAAGAAIRPRPLNQAALDTSLAMSSAEVKSRFASIAASLPKSPLAALRGLEAEPHAGHRHLVRHPVDDTVMAMIDAGPFDAEGGRRIWLPAFYVDIDPVSSADYGRFVAATGFPPPAHWPGGGGPEAIVDRPVQVTWADANAYAAWASKCLPSVDQWDRAVGQAGVTGGPVAEWCAAAAPVRRRLPADGPDPHDSAANAAFRCSSPVAEMLALLAI